MDIEQTKQLEEDARFWMEHLRKSLMRGRKAETQVEKDLAIETALSALAGLNASLTRYDVYAIEELDEHGRRILWKSPY